MKNIHLKESMCSQSRNITLFMVRDLLLKNTIKWLSREKVQMLRKDMCTLDLIFETVQVPDQVTLEPGSHDFSHVFNWIEVWL